MKMTIHIVVSIQSFPWLLPMGMGLSHIVRLQQLQCVISLRLAIDMDIGIETILLNHTGCISFYARPRNYVWPSLQIAYWRHYIFEMITDHAHIIEQWFLPFELRWLTITTVHVCLTCCKFLGTRKNQPCIMDIHHLTYGSCLAGVENKLTRKVLQLGKLIIILFTHFP